jgi:hypothetical protein
VAGTGQAAPATVRGRRRYVWPARPLQSGQYALVDDVGPSPSTRRLDLLARPGDLLVACRALSLAEAAFNPHIPSRWHTLDGVHTDEWVCRVSDGCGDEAVMWFSPTGAVIRGFGHESDMSPWAQEPMRTWPGLEDGMPGELRRAPTIMIGDVESVTFCIWWAGGASQWSIGPVEMPGGTNADADGSEYLLCPTSSVSQAHRFLAEAYDPDISEDLVAALFAQAPLDQELLEQLAVCQDAQVIEAEAARLRYPIS